MPLQVQGYKPAQRLDIQAVRTRKFQSRQHQFCADALTLQFGRDTRVQESDGSIVKGVGQFCGVPLGMDLKPLTI